MCGIYGASAKKGKKLNLQKIKMLGVYNIQRGTDSCGYYYSGHIDKGIGEYANFTKFIEKNEIERGDLVGEIFMGHTRKSTLGANTFINAHPHEIGNYVQTHNGTIKNADDICDKYGIDHKHLAVDSQMLGAAIEKVGFKVLEEYEGYAALAMTFKDDSESLYLYHGASREKEGGDLWEERPLFFLKQPEGIYYSSLAESLNFISTTKDKAIQMYTNCVLRITNGVFTDYEYEVKREHMNITKTVYYNNYYANSNGYYNNYKPITTPTNVVAKELPFDCCDIKQPKKDDMDIFKENYPIEWAEGGVYYRRGRFYTGDNKLLHGVYDISRKGNATAPTGSIFKDTFYFVRGAMMRDKKGYDTLINDVRDISTNLLQNTAYFLSKYSRYPVISLPTEGTAIYAKHLKEQWYKDGNAFSGSYTPKFSKRTYTIASGKLINIKSYKEDLIFLDSQDAFYEDELDIEVVVADTVEQDPIDTLVNEVERINDSQIALADIQVLPEYYYMYLDNYVITYKGADTPEKIVERETTLILKDLINLGMTFNQYCLMHNDATFTETHNIKVALSGYDVDELAGEINRYTIIDFNINETEVDEATKELLTTQLDDLLTHIDLFVGELKDNNTSDLVAELELLTSEFSTNVYDLLTK
jgi:predicted glutamine amidotransferase